MSVKPSSIKQLSRLGIAILGVMSLTACSSNSIDVSDWWRQVTNEREPQMVSYTKRRPILNQQMQSPAAQPTRPMPTPTPSASHSDMSFNQSGAMPAQGEPFLLDTIGDWLGGASSSNAQPNTPLQADYRMASMEENAPSPPSINLLNQPSLMAQPALEPVMVTAQNNAPKIRKPIAGNPRAAYIKEPSFALASKQASKQAPVEHDPSNAPRKPIAQVIQPAAQEESTPPIAIASASSQAPAMPWGDSAPLHTPLPGVPLPTAPQQLSILMPAAGGRTGEDQPDALNDSSTTDDDSELGVGGPFIASEMQSEIQEEIILTSGTTHTTQELSDSEYPPLSSVPTTPDRLKEVQTQHPAEQQTLEDAKQSSEQAREAIKEQIRQETPDSLLTREPQSNHIAPSSHTPAAIIMPPSQFEDETAPDRFSQKRTTPNAETATNTVIQATPGYSYTSVLSESRVASYAVTL